MKEQNGVISIQALHWDTITGTAVTGQGKIMAGDHIA